MTWLHDLHGNTSFKFCGKFKWVGTIVEFGADLNSQCHNDRGTCWLSLLVLTGVVIVHIVKAQKMLQYVTQLFDNLVNRPRGVQMVLFHLLLAVGAALLDWQTLDCPGSLRS